MLAVYRGGFDQSGGEVSWWDSLDGATGPRRDRIDQSDQGTEAAKVRLLELIESGWSAARAAREVGVHQRTGRNWPDGNVTTGNTRIPHDGAVTDYTAGTR